MNHGDTEARRGWLNKIRGRVIGLGTEIQRELGPGFLASACEEALAHELLLWPMTFERQRRMPIALRLSPDLAASGAH